LKGANIVRNTGSRIKLAGEPYNWQCAWQTALASLSANAVLMWPELRADRRDH
jgi:hypothetical protein